MTAPARVCPSCETVLPAEAGFCPACGEATPTEISGGTGAPRRPEATETHEREYRDRLQHALGQGYALGELIGRGGFGAVYAASDSKLERDVAIKAHRHDLFATPALLARFERETKSVAKLRHQHIVPIYSVGEGDGVTYMVMPMIKGDNLRTVLESEGKLSLDEAVRIATEVASALQAAHDVSIVHRDVKPENILLEGPERHVLLTDFGIAKAAEIADSVLTGKGTTLGTPLYMSPEQGVAGSLDHRSDIYSLGCVLYEMIAGDPPFLAATSQAVLLKHAEDPVPSVRKARETVSYELDKVVTKALAKIPDDRFASAHAFSASLTSAGRLLPYDQFEQRRQQRSHLGP